MNLIKRLFFSRPKYYLSLCCIQKDENEYLPEWIDYHRKIGVEHFYVYDNDSKVSPRITLSALIEQKIVTVIDKPGQVQQLPAYLHCLENFGNTSRWIGFIDIDEFIVPKQPHGDLPAFLKAYEDYGGVGINWYIFGSGGQKYKSDKTQVERFLLRSKKEFGPNVHIKTIAQPRYTKSIVTPHSFKYVLNKFCVNENFERIDGPFSPNSTDKIQLNHYYCRSLEEYQRKIERGRSDNLEKRDYSQFYAHDEGSNDVEDTSALEMLRNPVYKI